MAGPWFSEASTSHEVVCLGVIYIALGFSGFFSISYLVWKFRIDRVLVERVVYVSYVLAVSTALAFLHLTTEACVLVSLTGLGCMCRNNGAYINFMRWVK